MTGRLRAWSEIDELQHRVMDDLYEHDERLALLPTGFGKTMCSMTVGEELRAAGVIKRPLVLAPLRVAQNTWPAERFEWEHLQDVPMVQWGGKPSEWADSLWKESRLLWGSRAYYESRVVSIVDTVKRREMEDIVNDLITRERKVNKAIRATLPPEGWHVASFENSDWLTDLYAPGESPFDMVVVDETGKIARNPKSPRYKAFKKHLPLIGIRHGLNATPAPEGAEDLFGQVQIIAGKKLWGASFYQWRQKYFAPVDYHGHSWRLQMGAFDMLMNDLNTVSFRVPPEALKYQKNITHRQIAVDLPPKARAAYDDMEKNLAAEIAPGMDLVALSEASASQKLRQICQGYLYEVDAQGRRIVHHMHDEKTNALADLIDSMGREPLLVCYQFDEDLENIRKVFKNVPWLGQGVSSAKATENIERWNKRELPVLAMHPNCLHPNTLVLTEYSGWTKIVDVQSHERVFDGVEFVPHRGCQLSGVRPVIERFGITMTPDHLVLINDEWTKAKDVRDTGNVRQEARYTYAGDDPRLSALFGVRPRAGNAQAECGQEQQREAAALRNVLVEVAAQDDRHQTVPNLARHAGPHQQSTQPELRALRWSGYWRGSAMVVLQELLGRHAGWLRGRSDDRADGRERRLSQRELLLGNERRAASEQAQQSDRRIPRSEDALGRVLPRSESRPWCNNALPEPIRIGGHRREGVQRIVVPTAPSKPEEKVYDLVDCGPRNRFVVRNAEGEAFIVHNSASHGLNLQYGGHNICWLALPWGLDPYSQTNDRIDRRGQEHQCYGHHIVARNSKDDQVSEALIDKHDEQARIIAAIRSVS